MSLTIVGVDVHIRDELASFDPQNPIFDLLFINTLLSWNIMSNCKVESILYIMFRMLQ